MSPTKKPNSCGSERTRVLGIAALLLAGILAGCASGPARNAPPAISNVPEFSWISGGGRSLSSRNLRGQPMIILVANRPDQRNVRAQAARLQNQYRDFANLGTIFVAAFTTESGRVPTDLPFVFAADPAGLASRLGAEGDFTLYVVAKDGSVAMQTRQVQSGQTVLDVLINSRPQSLTEPR